MSTFSKRPATQIQPTPPVATTPIGSADLSRWASRDAIVKVANVLGAIVSVAALLFALAIQLPVK